MGVGAFFLYMQGSISPGDQFWIVVATVSLALFAFGASFPALRNTCLRFFEREPFGVRLGKGLQRLSGPALQALVAIIACVLVVAVYDLSARFTPSALPFMSKLFRILGACMASLGTIGFAIAALERRWMLGVQGATLLVVGVMMNTLPEVASSGNRLVERPAESIVVGTRPVRKPDSPGSWIVARCVQSAPLHDPDHDAISARFRECLETNTWSWEPCLEGDADCILLDFLLRYGRI